MPTRRDLTANYLGQAWTALMSFAFLPVYLRLLGADAFGLVGFFAMLVAWMSILDLGLGPTLSREAARFVGGARAISSMRDLLFSVECVAAGIAITISGLAFALSDPIAAAWLNLGDVRPEVASACIGLMGLVAALRLPEGLYRGMLVGLNEQVKVNLLISVAATVRVGGAITTLMVTEGSAYWFFAWQVGASILTTGVLRLMVGAALPKAPRRAEFSGEVLTGIRRFAGGVLATTLLATAFTQADKLILSAMLPLSEFGHYAMATTAAAALYYLSAPVTLTVFPRMSASVSAGDSVVVERTLHFGAQAVAVPTGAAAAVLVVFAEESLWFWTGDLALSRAVAPVFAFLASAIFVSCQMQVPYMLQLAHGWVSFGVIINFVMLCTVLPALLLVVPHWGTEGAGLVLLVANLAMFSLGMPIMFKRLNLNYAGRWFTQDVFKPCSTAFAVALTSHWMLVDELGRFTTGICLLAVGVLAGAGALLTCSQLRSELLSGPASKDTKEVS